MKMESATTTTTTTDLRDSPYITNFDLVPPSPSHHSNLDFESHLHLRHHHHLSPLFGAAFDDGQNNNNDDSHNNNNNIGTAPSSYNGSYFDSPYSQHSDLAELDFLQDFPTTDAGMNDYEPSDYDAPASNSLLMFSGGPFMSGMVAHSLLFDHGSPASSTGLEDVAAGAGAGTHSRSSSVASNNHPSPSAAQSAFHQPSTPRHDVVHSFGNMSVHTPAWAAQPLPSPRIGAVPLLSPQQKPQSPPRLTMPSSFDSEPTAVPKINAPADEDPGAGDAGGDGPSFNIVPATPVTGADGTTGHQHIPFQSNLATLTQDVELITDNNNNPICDPPPQQQQQQQHHHRTSPHESPLLLPSSHVLSTTMSFFPLQEQHQQQQQQQDHEIRQRRNSDSSTPWAGQNHQHLAASLSADDNSFAFQPQIDEQHRQQLHSFTFGGGSSSTNNNNNNYLTTGVGGDGIRRTVSDSLAAPRMMHRHSRSEEIRPLVAYGHAPGFAGFHGQSSSIGTTTTTTAAEQASSSSSYLFPPSSHGDFIQRHQQQQQQQTQFLHPNHLPAPGVVVGLSSPDHHQQQQHQQQQPSSVTERRSLSPGMGGQHHHHYRRASSGSRSERGGAEVWGTQPDPLLAHHPQLQLHQHHQHHQHHQYQSSASVTRRMSPYPTPSASPRVNFTQELDDLGLMGGAGAGGGGGLGLNTVGVGGEPLIGEPVSVGYTEDVSIAGRGGGMMMGEGASSHHQRAESVHSAGDDAAGGGGGGNQGGSQQQQQGVMKQSVTSGRTAHASIRRRKQEATFVCRVPGCGSTFTRGFNLKGHMRSHYEQKPYKCHWPGCDKGFARQHDCKRHEQLHSNYRPFACAGCGKNFARMDALNRHLRSEAGVECAARAAAAAGGGGGAAAKDRGRGGREEHFESTEDDGDDDDDDDMMMMMQDDHDHDERKPSGMSRRRNNNDPGAAQVRGLGNQLQLPWSVAL